MNVNRTTPRPWNARPGPSLRATRLAAGNARLLLNQLADDSVERARLASLEAGFVSDLGGIENMSAGQLALVQRASMLTLIAEMLEVRIAADWAPSPDLLEIYQRIANASRRGLRDLGLHQGRHAKPIAGTHALLDAAAARPWPS